jgi:hypothetical protein
MQLRRVEHQLIGGHAEERRRGEERQVLALRPAYVRQWGDREQSQRRDGEPDDREADDPELGRRDPDRRERARPQHHDCEAGHEHLEPVHCSSR